MKYGTIKYCDIANGTGVRTSLFVSGCTHMCRNCFNRDSWDFEYGEEFTPAVEKEILDSIAPSYISGLSLLGGEPMEPQNQRALISLVREFKRRYPQKTIWCYSGYTYEKDFLAGGRAYTEVSAEMLDLMDIMVDGKYIDELYDITLKFRGSSNQRIINLKESRRKGEIVLWEE
ncbi:MAG: anaerobic ribonucleoside-triphosphate reductase activating protein [Johnsonella sp.]|nr:anaerobic ribonucleoside-triphosphate reductase activating protein [Johnsonella sp.]